ncbi:MAG: HIT domain-containing protein [Candidatus Aminicenantes bacterium]|nr:HIT domain-containing protein [Candidatus Aminicenantes bacterium]MCK4432147.1 HIT domain-containing protein [Candidatus Aminicenantes bacterium]
MEYIYAPWREEYVKKVFKMKECIFCHALKLKNDKKAHILYRGKYNFIVLNKYPYTPGHLMIAPYKHLDSFEQAEKESTDEFSNLLKLCLKVLRKKYNPHGFNTGMNLGQSAGAGVAKHYHLHIIPRWVGDSNFMPLISKTKVVIEDLEITYSRLSPLFQEEK